MTEHNFDMMKKRKESKDIFPSISEDELNTLFPFRKAEDKDKNDS